ncbi:MAG: TRAP transporter substrate-binding protein DctP, partial [Gemmatimonadales bacterium]
VFIALQTGVMDGQENPLSNIATSRLHEVQEYLSLTGHVYSPAYLTVASERWAQLPADVREILEATARATQEFVLTKGEEIDSQLLEELKAAGIRINDADRESFVAASRVVYEAFGSAVPGGRDLIERALALAGEDGR